MQAKSSPYIPTDKSGGFTAILGHETFSLLHSCISGALPDHL